MKRPPLWFTISALVAAALAGLAVYLQLGISTPTRQLIVLALLLLLLLLAIFSFVFGVVGLLKFRRHHETHQEGQFGIGLTLMGLCLLTAALIVITWPNPPNHP